MSKLPVLSGKEVVRFFLKRGYIIDHQTGSHIILRKEGNPPKRLTVPNHPEIAKGTLLAIIKQSGIPREDFIKEF